MRLAGFALAGLLLCALTFGQQPPANSVLIAAEPHHSLLLDNEFVRVYRLTLQPGAATLPHRHEGFYFFISMQNARLANEVRGRQPIVSELLEGELRTSKGGFTQAERNTEKIPVKLIVVEPKKSGESGTFEEKMVGFRFHDAAFGPIFEAGMARGYDGVMASEGRTENHLEKYDRLLVALSDMSIDDQIEGGGHTKISLETGEIAWLSGGAKHATVNVGSQPAHFITIEFR